MYLIAFPLLLIPFVLYNMVAFLFELPVGTRLFGITLLSGVSVTVSIGDMLVIVSVLLLYFEILKATRLAAKAIMDHLLALMLFAGMVFEFVSISQAGTQVFLILIVVAFVDVVTGLSVARSDVRRNLALEVPDQISAAG